MIPQAIYLYTIYILNTLQHYLIFLGNVIQEFCLVFNAQPARSDSLAASGTACPPLSRLKAFGLFANQIIKVVSVVIHFSISHH